jgi:hypothetical protein
MYLYIHSSICMCIYVYIYNYIHRLITRRSFEAEMFERASKKLGLEQALLGKYAYESDYKYVYIYIYTYVCMIV